MIRASEIPTPKSAVRGIAWPAIPDMTGNILLTLLFQLEQSQWWSPERLRDAQFGQANSLLSHAFGSHVNAPESLAASPRPSAP